MRVHLTDGALEAARREERKVEAGHLEGGGGKKRELQLSERPGGPEAASLFSVLGAFPSTGPSAMQRSSLEWPRTTGGALPAVPSGFRALCG